MIFIKSFLIEACFSGHFLNLLRNYMSTISELTVEQSLKKYRKNLDKLNYTTMLQIIEVLTSSQPMVNISIL